jgi:hypothetical protein
MHPPPVSILRVEEQQERKKRIYSPEHRNVVFHIDAIFACTSRFKLLLNFVASFAQVGSRFLIIRDHGPTNLPLNKCEAEDEKEKQCEQNVLCSVRHVAPLTDRVVVI